MSKKLEEKQRRREAEERREQERRSAVRKRNFVTLGVALLVGALVVGLIINERDRETAALGVDEEQAGCTDIETFEEEGRDHVDEGTPVQYRTSPPTSGPHYANFSEPGFFEEPVDQHRLVHNLEHGQIVFWYRPDAPEQTIENLRSLVSSDRIALLAAPYDGIESPYEFAMTAWTAMQKCQEVSQVVVDNFRRRYQGRGPENVGIPPFRPGT